MKSLQTGLGMDVVARSYFIALGLIRLRLERLERFPERFQCIKRTSLGCLPSGTVSRGVDEAIS